MALTLAACAGACEDSPVSPPPPPSPFVTELRISGPESIAPGGSGQFTAIAVSSDGSSSDVTAQATWEILPRHAVGVLSVSSTGLATGHHRGEAFLQARYRSRESLTDVLVLPEGTFRVSGHVTDDGFGLPGVLVEEISAHDPELSTTTNEYGNYWLYGVPPNAELSASKSGYETRTQAATISDHSAIVDIGLSPSAPRPSWAGSYTLTIVADPACATELPTEVWTRSYSATVEQSGARIDVTLAGANFIVSFGTGNAFSGRVEPDQVIFDLTRFPWYYYYYPPLSNVVEQLSPSLVFSPWGTAIVRGVPSGLSGNFVGYLATFPAPLNSSSPTAACHSDSHQFILSR